MSFSPLRRSIPCHAIVALFAMISIDSTAQHAADGVSSTAIASVTWADPDKAPAEVLPLASRSLLLDAVRCANRYLVVGSRGDILVSDDSKEWRQIVTPTRATLTAATAIDAHVWAVGHDGVILHSADGGEHWMVQRDDPLQTTPPGGDAARNPQQGAPLLDVLFLDTHRGFAVGAYSLALSTTDGGAHWEPMTVAIADAATDDEIDTPKLKKATNDKSTKSDKQTFSDDELKVGQESSPHLNGIAKTGSGALFIVGERGSAFRSRDNGATWQRLQLPYDGSMFGVIGYDADRVVAFGLRGHVYESTDLGDHWQSVSTGTQLSLMGGAALPGGGAVIVGANGIVLTRAKFGESLHSDVDEPAGIIANVLPLESDGVLLVGENGVSIHSRKQ